MSFADEIKNYTDDDLELIVSTQKDLYSQEEMEQLKALQAERRRIKKEEHDSLVLSRLPKTINCEKCDGPNLFSNEVCDYCGYKMNKTKYYTDEYYEQAEENKGESSQNEEDNYTFHYIISFLIPLVGFIVGAIMLANDTQKTRARGKTCILIGVFSIIVSVFICWSYLV